MIVQNAIDFSRNPIVTQEARSENFRRVIENTEKEMVAFEKMIKKIEEHKDRYYR